MKTESVHKTVLLKETIEGLNLNKDQSLVIDATFGGGGHSKQILEEYKNTKIIALDQDKGAWDRAKDKFKGLEKRITFLNLNFREINNKEKVDGIIFYLGLSSDQLENSGRGFSFMKDEPLLMTMKENPLPEDLTAMDIVNNWGEENLADIIYGYGEERFSRRIAKAIVEFRKKNQINSTFTLVKIIEDSVPRAYKKGRIHCATKTFQALRIAVNDELRALEEGLNKGFEILKNGGRMSVISFHSLEDRVVKRFFKKLEKDKKAKLIPARNALHSDAGGNKKIITATNEEIKNNGRSRSAKLRILEKI